MKTRSRSYPFLDIARSRDLDYGAVLDAADYVQVVVTRGLADAMADKRLRHARLWLQNQSDEVLTEINLEIQRWLTE